MDQYQLHKPLVILGGLRCPICDAGIEQPAMLARPGAMMVLCRRHLLSVGIYGERAARESVLLAWDHVDGRVAAEPRVRPATIVPALGDDPRRRSRRIRRRRRWAWLRRVLRWLVGALVARAPEAQPHTGGTTPCAS